jgi:chemotaxis protein methyltransferase CheR
MSARAILGQRLSDWTGFDLERGGRLDALDRLIDQRIAALGLGSADAYLEMLSRPDDPEASRLINAITVGHTWFFRDREQTDAVAEVLRSSLGQGRRVRVWVAGCSTGEEAYTIAMLAESIGIDVEVLGTDINSEALQYARAGEFSQWSVRDVPREFSGSLTACPGGVTIATRLRRQVRFEWHNLIESAPERGGPRWDLILCRNVLIYFRRDQAARAIGRFGDALANGGWLFLGASDVLAQVPPGFEIVPIGARYALRRLGAPAGDGPGIRLSLGFPPKHDAPRVPAAAEPTAPALIEEALVHVDAGAPDKAIPLCIRALELDPLSGEAHLVSGIAYHVAEDPHAAARSLRSALVLTPNEWLASFYLALTLDRLGREREAEREYQRVETALVATHGYRSRLPTLDAYRGEIAVLARSRAARGKLR